MTEPAHFGTSGTVFLVGAGPGDPDLLTLRAARLLMNAQVVVHDGLVDPAVLAMAPRGARFISVAKRRARHTMPQEEINALLVPFGKHVCTQSAPACSTCPLLSMCQQVGVTKHK